MKIIAMTAYKRPTLLYSCLKSITDLYGVEHWETWILIDPSDFTGEIVEIIKLFQKKGFRIEFTINDSKLGVRRNPYKLLQWCFGNNADLILYLEDDVIVSNDCLKIAESVNNIPDFSSSYLCGNLLTTTCNSQSVLCLPKYEHSNLENVFIENIFFSSLGIILNKHQFIKHFEPNWFNHPLKLRSFRGQETDGWDLAINDYLLSTDNLFVVQSILPRISHQGTSGTHADYNFHKRAFSHVNLYESSSDSFTTSEESNFSVQVLKRNDVANLDSLSCSFIKSYINIIHDLTDLQISSIAVEEQLKNEVNTVKNDLTDLQISSIAVEEQLKNEVNTVRNDKKKSLIEESNLLRGQVLELKKRLNKKSIWIAEKIAFTLNRIFGRNQ